MLVPYAGPRATATLALAGLLAATALAAPAPSIQAVAAFDGGVVRVAGVQVVAELSAIGQAIVRGTPAALRRLAAAPGVVGVAPDGAVALSGKGGGRGTGVLSTDGLGGRAGTPGAGRGVTVAVVDTGVADTPSLNRASGRLVDGFSVDSTYSDAHGHGTFMASLIAGGPADGSDGEAVGVAPAATVVVVKVAGATGQTSLSRVVAGLDWVARNAGHVDVANLSFSHSRPGGGYGGDPLNAAVERVRAAGVLPVVSAGNVAGRVGDPGFHPQVLTVGAADLTSATESVAPWSGSDLVAGVRKPDVVASGVSVLGVLPPGSVVARTHPKSHSRGALWRGTGTSQGTAIVTGVAALLLQVHPSATPAQVKASLRSAAQDLPGQRDGAGLVEVTGKVVSGPDGSGYGGGDGDLTGEGSFDASSWSASSWSASSWSASSWSASSWSASSWSASSWSSRWAL